MFTRLYRTPVSPSGSLRGPRLGRRRGRRSRLGRRRRGRRRRPVFPQPVSRTSSTCPERRPALSSGTLSSTRCLRWSSNSNSTATRRFPWRTLYSWTIAWAWWLANSAPECPGVAAKSNLSSRRRRPLFKHRRKRLRENESKSQHTSSKREREL